MIKILNQALELQAVLNIVDDPLITEEINGLYTFDFTTVIDTEKSQYINYQNIIEIEDNYFNIVYYKKNRNADDTTIIETLCEHRSYDLLEGDNVLDDGFTAYGTPTQIMTQLFQGTPFTVGIVEITSQNTISVNEATNKREVLLLIAKTFGGELKFNKLAVSLLIRRGADRGVQFRYRKNLISCSYIVDNRKKVNGLPTVSVDVDVAELEFANGGMADEYYEIGDTVTVIEPDLGVNIPARIMKESHNPLERMKGNVNISNVIEDISDTIIQMQQQTVYKESVYNGCKIGPKDGFEAIRSDKLVRAILNATYGIAIQKGDGSGSDWVSKFFIDDDGNQHMKDTFIELIGELVTILLDPSVGIKISNDNGDMLFVDLASGKLKLKDIIIELTRSDGKTRILIDTANGNKIQKNTGTVQAPVWEDVNYQDTDGNSIIKGFIIASKFFGATKDSAYLEIGTGGGGNLGDLKLFRGTGGGNHPVFSVYDDISSIRLMFGTGSSAPVAILYVGSGTTYPQNTWNCSGANFSNLKNGYGEFYATLENIDDAIANHVAAFHSGI